MKEHSRRTPYLFTLDTATGQEVARLEAPMGSAYGMSTWVQEGKQHLILQTGSTLTAMTLPN